MLKIWQGSSAGESARLIPVRSRVRISPLLNKEGLDLFQSFFILSVVLIRFIIEFERVAAEGEGLLLKCKAIQAAPLTRLMPLSKIISPLLFLMPDSPALVVFANVQTFSKTTLSCFSLESVRLKV